MSSGTYHVIKILGAGAEGEAYLVKDEVREADRYAQQDVKPINQDAVGVAIPCHQLLIVFLTTPHHIEYSPTISCHPPSHNPQDGKEWALKLIKLPLPKKCVSAIVREIQLQAELGEVIYLFQIQIQLQADELN